MRCSPDRPAPASATRARSPCIPGAEATSRWNAELRELSGREPRSKVKTKCYLAIGRCDGAACRILADPYRCEWRPRLLRPAPYQCGVTDLVSGCCKGVQRARLVGKLIVLEDRDVNHLPRDSPFGHLLCRVQADSLNAARQDVGPSRGPQGPSGRSGTHPRYDPGHRPDLGDLGQEPDPDEPGDGPDRRRSGGPFERRVLGRGEVDRGVDDGVDDRAQDEAGAVGIELGDRAVGGVGVEVRLGAVGIGLEEPPETRAVVAGAELTRELRRSGRGVSMERCRHVPTQSCRMITE